MASPDNTQRPVESLSKRRVNGVLSKEEIDTSVLRDIVNMMVNDSVYDPTVIASRLKDKHPESLAYMDSKRVRYLMDNEWVQRQFTRRGEKALKNAALVLDLAAVDAINELVRILKDNTVHAKDKIAASNVLIGKAGFVKTKIEVALAKEKPETLINLLNESNEDFEIELIDGETGEVVEATFEEEDEDSSED